MNKFSMKTNPLKNRLDEKRLSFGLFVSELRSPWLGTMLDSVGYDFCILDMEHGAFSFSEISGMVAGFQGSRCTPLVRIPGIAREAILPLLDFGVGGIVVPGVESAEEVRQCVDFMKYPPKGSRGFSLSRPHAGFASPDRDQFLAEANARNLLIVQIESPKALENLDNIVSVPGIDVVFVGCADLSLSLGIPNNPTNETLRKILDRVMETALRCGIHGGANITDSNVVHALHEKNLNLVTCTTDTKGFLDGIAKPLQSLKKNQ